MKVTLRVVIFSLMLLASNAFGQDEYDERDMLFDATTCQTAADCVKKMGSTQYGCYDATVTDLLSETRLAKTKLPKEPKKVGEVCKENPDCETFYCKADSDGEPKTCRAVKICRPGRLWEVVTGDQICVNPLIPKLNSDGNKTCQLTDEASLETTLGLAGDISLQSVSEKCGDTTMTMLPTNYTNRDGEQTDLTGGAEELDALIRFSLKNIRVMEWLFKQNLFLDQVNFEFINNEDCLGLMTFMKNRVDVLVSKRVEIVNEFNNGLGKIEEDEATLRLVDEDKYELPADGVVIAGDKYDNLDILKSSRQNIAFKLMKEKSKVFGKMEGSLKGIYEDLRGMFSYLNSELAKKESSFLSNDSMRWSIESGSYWGAHSGRGCPWTVNHTLQNRWNIRFEVEHHKDETVDYFGNVKFALSKSNIKDYISAISGADPIRAMYLGVDPLWFSDDQYINNTEPPFDPKNELVKDKVKNYFLLDPVLPGITFKSIGEGSWSGYRRILKHGSFRTLHENFRISVAQYYKDAFKDASLKIVEPELLPITTRNCFGTYASYWNRGSVTEPLREADCAAFFDYLEEITDLGFAQFWAFSVHREGSYVNFHNTAYNFRRKLLKSYEVSLMNLISYYDALGKIRAEQEGCIDNIQNSQSQNGDGGGFTPISFGGYGGSSRSGDYGPGPGDSLGEDYTKKPKKFDDKNFDNKDINLDYGNGKSPFSMTKTFKDGDFKPTNQDTKGSGVVKGNGGGIFAIADRRKQLDDQNKKAVDAKTKFLQRDKISRAAIKAIGSKSYFKNTGDSSLNKTAGNNFKNFSTHHSELPKDASKETTNADQVINVVNAKSDKKDVKKNNQPKNLAKFLSDSSEEELVAQNGAGTAEVISDIPDRSSKELTPQEGDDLFQVVSKAYVRNLERILIRKKKVVPPQMDQ